MPLSIMAVCIYAGYLTAFDQGTKTENFPVVILAGVIGGALFAHGYVEKKFQIFFWALIGIVIASATAMVQRENQVFITNLFLEAFWGSFIGLLNEKNSRGVAIGALIMGLLFAGLAFFASSRGGVYISGIKIDNLILSTLTIFTLGAWKGALIGGFIMGSWTSYRSKKEIA